MGIRAVAARVTTIALRMERDRRRICECRRQPPEHSFPKSVWQAAAHPPITTLMGASTVPGAPSASSIRGATMLGGSAAGARTLTGRTSAQGRVATGRRVVRDRAAMAVSKGRMLELGAAQNATGVMCEGPIHTSVG